MTIKIKKILASIVLMGLLCSAPSAFQCPDPSSSSLAWGETPVPWQENPYSTNRPQGEKDTQFVRANILVTSTLGQGISCTYQNSVGYFSIWWPTRCQVPVLQDNYWAGTQSGYVCSVGIEDCHFVVVNN